MLRARVAEILMRPRTDRKRIVASQTARLQVFGGYLLLSGVLVSLGLAIPAMPTEHAAAWFDPVALALLTVPTIGVAIAAWNRNMRLLGIGTNGYVWAYFADIGLWFAAWDGVRIEDAGQLADHAGRHGGVRDRDHPIVREGDAGAHRQHRGVRLDERRDGGGGLSRELIATGIWPLIFAGLLLSLAYKTLETVREYDGARRWRSRRPSSRRDWSRATVNAPDLTPSSTIASSPRSSRPNRVRKATRPSPRRGPR